MSRPPAPQQELESYLWGAATILRGLVDAGDYKQYVFPLLFYKRLSDVWDEEYAAALAETGDEGYAPATANDRFVIPDGAHWNDVRAAPTRCRPGAAATPCAPSRPPTPTGWTASSAMRRGPTRSACPTPRSRTCSSTSRSTRSRWPTCPRMSWATATST